MKKKIINGILMVAMFFAATTSFVSCKDNVDDELIPVYAQLAQQKTDLQEQINLYKTQIENLTNQVNNQDQKITQITEMQNNLQTKIDALQTQLNTINEQIATLSADVETIQNELNAVKSDVEGLAGDVADLRTLIMDLYDIVNNLITGIQINQTISNPTGTINLPGGMLRLNALAAFYGENVLGLREFPTAKFEENHIFGADNMLTADEVVLPAEQRFAFLEDGYITQPHDNAGMLFFTVNSVDPENFDISQYTLSVENSLGMTAPITFSDVKPSSYDIQWGIFKSPIGVDSDPDLNGNPTFFQASANIAQEDLEASKFNLNKFFDLKSVATDVKESVEAIKAAEGNKAKLTSIAKIVLKKLTSIYSGNMSGNDKDIKNPSWSAQKLVLSKEVDGVNKKVYADDYDLAVSAIAPLSYNSFWEMEGALASSVDLSILEDAVANLAKAIKAALPNASSTTTPEIKKISADGMQAYVQLAGDEDGQTATWVSLDETIFKAINEGLDIDNLNKMLADASSVIDLGATVDNVAARFNSYLENIANSIVGALKNHALTRAVTPVVLFKSANGISILRSGMTVKAGTMQINVTSPTEELIVPAYAKYVAVINADNGKAVQASVVPGGTQLFDLDLTKAGNYKVIVSSVDYYGFIVNKKYNITVE